MNSTTTHASLLSLVADVARLGQGHSLACVAATVAAGAMPALHTHDDDEAVYVVEGLLTVYAGHDAVVLGPGECHLLPAGLPHTYCAEQRTRLLSLAVVRSISDYDDWARAVRRPVTTLAGDWPDSAEAACLERLGASNGITVLGPPGARP